MPRIPGLQPRDASFFTRLLYKFVKRKTAQLTGHARLLEPIMVHAHHPRLLRALGQMEMGQAAAAAIPATLKSLASVRAATLIGCPF